MSANPESLSPQTDALHIELKGDWKDCYSAMHLHAVRIESLYTRLAEKYRVEGELQKASPIIARADLKRMTVAELMAWLNNSSAIDETRKITIPES